ncbi:hypothetical protein BST61_g157 [Cercospora zeina]
MAAAAAKAPDDFEVLTETISIHRPKTTTSLRSSDETRSALFVICSWMGALPKHIQKYTDQYQKLYPSSTILLVQSTWKDVAGTDDFMKTRLEVAISVIKDRSRQQASTATSTDDDDDTTVSEDKKKKKKKKKPAPQHQPKIFLHIFSNGGATIANHLSIQLNSSFSSSSSSRHIAFFTRLILECTPSRPNTTQAVQAMSAAALPSTKFPSLIRLIGAFLIRCFVSYGFWKCWLLGRENMVDRLRRRLNSPLSSSSHTTNKPMEVKEQHQQQQQQQKEERIWPTQTPRLYMYSRSDAVVSWEDVRDHAEEAREKLGFENVREEIFESAPHVGLPREDFGRYWGVVEGWWSQG